MVPRITINTHKDTHVILDALLAYKATATYERLPERDKETVRSLFESVGIIHDDFVTNEIARQLQAALKETGLVTVDGKLTLPYGVQVSGHAVSVTPDGEIIINDLREFLG